MAEIVINDIDPINPYTAAGGELGFDYDFPIFDSEDLKVLQITDAGAISTLAEGTDYTVSGVGVATGGTMTFDVTAFPSGATEDYRYVLYRDMPISRLTNFLSGGDFKASTVNRELDEVIMLIQQVALDLKRSITLQKADEEDEINLAVETAAERASKFLKFGANGNTVEAGASSGDIENAAANAAAAEAALDEFTDIYLGEHASDPTTDNDGDALQEGALYFNSTTNVLKYYTGSTWQNIGANTDETAKVSSNDTTAGYLNGKLVAGTGITLTEQNDGSNETLEVSSSSQANETGDMLPTFKTTAKSGWLIMNGETIGDASSGADNESATYEDLFTFLWDNVADTYAPVSTGRGASAAADWGAGKTITIPDMRGRGFVGTGQGTGLTKTWANGEGDGSETVTLVEANLPAHTHASGSLATSSAGAHQHDGNLGYSSVGSASGSYPATSSDIIDTSGNTNVVQSAGAHTHTMSGSTASTGSGTAADIQNPMRAASWQIKI